MKYKLVIFDLDGTLLDTLEDLADSMNFVLEKYGFPRRELYEIRAFVGNGIFSLVKKSAPESVSDGTLEEMHKTFIEHYGAHCADKTRPYEGVCELLSELRGRGALTAVVSNKADAAVRSLCGKYFDGLLDIALGERAGVRKKPAPDTVNEVLRLTGVSREFAVYVGDSEVDVRTCRNARVTCLAVDWGFRDAAELRLAGADTVLSSCGELRRALISEDK